jgi:hypothetical protein
MKPVKSLNELNKSNELGAFAAGTYLTHLTNHLFS